MIAALDDDDHGAAAAQWGGGDGGGVELQRVSLSSSPSLEAAGVSWFISRRSEGPALFVGASAAVQSWEEDLRQLSFHAPALHDSGVGRIFLLSTGSSELGEPRRAHLEAKLGVVLQFSLVVCSAELLMHLREDLVDIALDARSGQPLPFVLATTPQRTCFSWALASAPARPLGIFRQRTTTAGAAATTATAAATAAASVLPDLAALALTLREELPLPDSNARPTPTGQAGPPCPRGGGGGGGGFGAGIGGVGGALSARVAQCVDSCRVLRWQWQWQWQWQSSGGDGGGGSSGRDRRAEAVAKVSFLQLPAEPEDED